MPKYFVNRSSGWPLDPYAQPRWAYGEELDSDSPEASKAAESGYLIEIIDHSAAVAPAPIASTHTFEFDKE